MNKKKNNTVDTQLSLSAMRKRAVRSSAILLIRQFVLRALGFVGLLVLARLLSPETFGVFAILHFIILFFEQAGSFGLSSALIRQREEVTELQFRVVFSFQLLILSFSILFILIFSPLVIAHFDFDDYVQDAIYWLLLALIFSSLKTIPKIQLERQLLNDKVAIAEIAEYVIYLFIAVYLSMIGVGLWALVIATIARSLTGVVILYYFSAWRPSLELRFEILKSLFRFAAPIQVTSWIDLGNRSLIPVVIGSLAGPQMVGLLNLARTLLDTLIYQPVNLLGKIQLRVFGRIQDDKIALSRNLRRSYLLGSSIAFLPLCIIAALSYSMIEIVLGEKWIDAALPISIMCAGYGFYAVLQSSTKCLHALNDAWSPLVLTIIRVVMTFLITYFGYQHFGLLSFPIAIAVSIPFSAILTYFYVNRRLKSGGLSFVFAPLLAAIFTSVILLFAFPQVSSVYMLFIKGVVGAGFYILFLGMFVGSEIVDIIKIIKENQSANSRYLGRFLAILERLFNILSILRSRNI